MLVAVSVPAACSPGTVNLRYTRTKQAITYSVQLRSRTSADSSRGRQASEVRLRARLVERTKISGTMLVLTPEQLVRDGIRARTLPSPLVLEINKAGLVTELEGAGPLDGPREQAIAGFRPPLPSGPVRIGEEWSAASTRRTESSSVILRGSAKLTGFLLRSGRRLAQIAVVRRGNARMERSEGRTSVQLEGPSRETSTVLLDVDLGIVVEARTWAISNLLVRSAGERFGRVEVETVASVRLDQGS